MAKDTRVNISGTVPAELAEFVETYRWANRKSRSDVVSDALALWAKENGYVAPTTGEVPAETETAAPEAEKADATAAPEAPKADESKGASRRVTRAG